MYVVYLLGETSDFIFVRNIVVCIIIQALREKIYRVHVHVHRVYIHIYTYCMLVYTCNVMYNVYPNMHYMQVAMSATTVHYTATHVLC